jgi:acyl-CoA oxidase
MEVRACLAMTESGHGSAVKRLQTEARYQPKNKQFVLTTPTPDSHKNYVCSALSADLALLFARLITDDQDKGIHAFLVPLRDDNDMLLPGVDITECSPMGGLTGLDYGTISLKGVTVPKENQLERHGYLEDDGTYRLNLSSHSHRFNALTGSLVVGRSLVTGGAAAGAKTALTIAVGYAGSRRQFRSETGDLENTILSYQAVQKRLMPQLATLLAIEAGRSRLAQTQHEYFEDSKQDRELETFTGALKAYTTYLAVEVAQSCRQTCGGAGCLRENRLTELARDLDMFITTEGDNPILEMMVARNLLFDFKRGLDRSKLANALDWVLKGVGYVARTAGFKSRDASSDTVTDRVFLAKALRFRRDRLRFSLARRVQAGLANGHDFFDVLNGCQDHCIALCRAYCEEKIFRCLRNVMESCPPGWDHRVMNRALTLFALYRIEQDRGWFLEHSYLNSKQTRAIRDEALKLCSELAQESEMILSSFELPHRLLRAPLLSR